MVPSIEEIGHYVLTEGTIQPIQEGIQRVEATTDLISELSRVEASPQKIYERLRAMGVCYIEKVPLTQLQACEQTEDRFDYVIFGLTPEILKGTESPIVVKWLLETRLREILGDNLVKVTDKEALFDGRVIKECAQKDTQYFENFNRKPLYTYLEHGLDGVRIGFIAGTKIYSDSQLAQLVEDTKKFSQAGLKTNKVLIEREEGQWNYVEDRDLRKLPEVFRDLREEGYIPTLNFYIEMCKTGRMRIGMPHVEGLSKKEPLRLIETGFYCVGQDFPGVNREWGYFKNPVLNNERMYFIKVYHPEEDNFGQMVIEQYREPVFIEYIEKLSEHLKEQKNEPGPMVRIAKISSLNNR